MRERPKTVTVEEWRKVIRDPLNAAMLPIHVSRQELDTLDISELDPRYHYILVQRSPLSTGTTE